MPFQWIFGFPRYQPVFVAVILLGNALSFRPLARRVVGPGAAAWGATLLWELAPYTLFELMTGRLTQAFLWFLPPAVLAFLRVGEDRRWRGLRAPILAGLATGMLAWTYWFYGYFLALLLAWLAALALFRGERPRKALIRGYLVAGLACLLVVAPGVWAMAGRQAAGAVPGVAEGGGSWLSWPETLQNNVASTLHGYLLLERHGQPMFGNLAWGGGVLAWLALGRERLRFGGFALIALAFALGPVLPVGEGLPMPHYLFAYHHLPFFDRLWFPYRLVVFAFLAASLGIGTALARLLPRLGGGARRAWLVAALPALVTAAEQHRHLAFPLLHRDFRPPAVMRWVGEVGGGLIELPIGIARVSIAWQAVHHQPTFGGMGENAPIFWPPGFRRRLRNGFIHDLRQLTRDPRTALDYDPADRERLVAEGFRWVVLDRHLVDADLHRWPWYRRASPAERDRAPFAVQDRITRDLGEPVAAEGPLVVWDLVGGAEPPEDLRPTPASLNERTWPTDDMPAYEAHYRELGRLPAAPGRR